MYLPLKTVEGFTAKLAVVFLFPLWSFWIGWRKKIDLIIAFGSLYAFLQGFSKWILKRPMVTFIRGSSYFGLTIQDSPRYFLRFSKIVEYLGLLFSDRIITNNIAARDEILKSLGKRKDIDAQVLYNNIPPMNISEPENVYQTRDRYGVPRNAKVLVTAGILNPGKKIDMLISCLPRIGIKDLCLLVVGDGSREVDLRYKDSLQGLARKLGVDKRVIFTGWLEKKDLWKIYVASDLFVLPSLSEGMPNAMLEALGSGLPCMGSNIAGVKDVLKYDELMFDPFDEKMFIERVERFFFHPEFSCYIERLCSRRKKVLQFDWKKAVLKMVTDIYCT